MRAPNMQSLTNDTKARHPGVTIYGKGDPAHQATSSNHNEDDTPGVRTPQTDLDNIPEHRAIDVMIGEHFTKADADAYVEDLLKPESRARLVEIIWNRHIWTAARGWEKRDYVGKDPHTNHVHAAGAASDDANASPWYAIRNGGSMTISDADKAFFRAAPWQYNGGGIGENSPTVQRSMLSYQDEMLKLIRRIATEVNIDAAELAQIEASAEAGAKAAFEEQMDEMVTAIVNGIIAGLDPEDLNMEAVTAAVEVGVRNVLIHGVVPATEG